LHTGGDLLRRYALLLYERVVGQRGQAIPYLVYDKRTEGEGESKEVLGSPLLQQE
jgi:hypothetical protein